MRLLRFYLRFQLRRCSLRAAAVLLFATSAVAQNTVVLAGATPVGQQAAAVAVTVNVTASGTAVAPQALTLGAPELDYALGGGGTCAAGVSYSVGQQCTANVIFSPLFPGARLGAVVLRSSSGSLLGETLLKATGTAGLAVLNPGRIDTVAGNGDWIYAGDGMLAINSPVFLPTGVLLDGSGNIFFSDSSNNRIRRVDAQSGLISTYAGDGTPGYSGDGGAATAAAISSPAALALDGAGNLYFVDSGNNAVRRVDAVSGIVTTVAGTPTQQGYSGDGAAATDAKLSLPEGLSFDATGNFYIADTGNNVIRKVAAHTGVITTVAGTGVSGFNGNGNAATSTLLDSPWGVAFAPDGTLYIADPGNNMVRKINADGTVSAVAGYTCRGNSGDGGVATQACLNAPSSITFDPAGSLYIADSGNNRIRKVDETTGWIETLCGGDSEQFTGDTGPANIAGLYGPSNVFIDPSGNLFLTDMFHNRVRKISASALPLHYDTMRVGKVSSPMLADVVNDGNASLTLSAPTLVYAQVDAVSTTCATGSALEVDTTCIYGIDFAPTVTGNPVMGSLTVDSDSPNLPPVITLSGNVLSVNPTGVTLTSSQNPSFVNTTVIFTATVSNGAAAATGGISFLDGTTQICLEALDSTASATCITSALALGQHSITASYQGDTYNAASVSAALIQIVKQQPSIALVAAPNPTVVSATVTLTATATAPSGTPTGTVTFYDGNTSLGTGTLNSFGVATLATTSLAAGTHSLSAAYGGDAINAVSTSYPYSEVVQQAPSITMIATSNASVTVGTAITFTASVSAPNAPQPTGTVTFTDGYTPIGTATLNSSGTAALQPPSLAPGTHHITATYSGDINDATSASSPLVETILQIATATTVTADANPANAGATLHLTAHVALAAGAVPDGVISGQASFSDGSTVLGIVTLDSNGNAVLALNTLQVGNHSITATYSGNTNYAASTSASLSQVIISTTSITGLSSNNLTALAGKPVMLTATLTTPTGIPTGVVAFRDGNLTLGQGTLNAQGLATFTTSTLAVGGHTMTAVYGGDANYLGSTSAPLTETISVATTALVLAGPSAPVNAGVSTTLTGTLTGNGVSPTGTITLRDGGTAIATQSAPASGSFTFSSSTLSVGTHSFTATYAGDADNASATSNTVTLVVQLTPTATSLASSANPQVLGRAVTFTTAVTSTTPAASGSITFNDGSAVLGSVSLVNGTAAYTTSSLTVGPHTITAVYSGDSTHATSSSTAISQQIVQAATLALVSSLNPSVSGTNIVFTAQLTGVGSVVPTGHIVFSDGSAPLGSVAVNATGAASFSTSTLSVGSHNVAAAYAGDANYASATAGLTQTVGSASTQIVLRASANPATYNTPLSLTATIASDGGIATGQVAFTDGGVAIGSATLNASGAATLILSTLHPGAHSIVASYGGDGKATASASTPLIVTVKQITQTALASSANPAQTLSSIPLTATVTNSGVGTATGNVTFYDGTTLLGTAALDSAGHATLTATSLAAGNHSLQASYAGDGDNFGSASALLNEGVGLRPTTTALSATQTSTSDPLQVTLIGVVRPASSAPTPPTGTVTFNSGSLIIGSASVDATGVATLTVELQTTSESITATYSGDASFATSQSVATTVTGGPATQFTMTLNPSSASLQSKQHIVISLTLTSVKSFTDTLELGCLGLPLDATCTFSKPRVSLPANGTATVQLTLDTGDPLGAGATARLDHGKAAMSKSALLCFFPVGMLALLLLRPRRRNMPGLLLAVLLLAGAFGLGGCSGLLVNGTPAGTYAFKVTASGVGTGATQSAVMNLTVTP